MPEEKTLNLATLVFPVQGDKVWLGRKMRKIGAGCLNGWGGGVEPGESVVAAAIREFHEETGGVIVDEKDLKKVGIVHFKNHKSDGTVFVCTVHVFTVSKWTGQIVSTAEMQEPKEYSIKTLDRNELMPADPFWLPRMLSGELGIAWTEYGPFQKTLIGEVRFESVSSLPEE
jgi:8-oxo-dGTP pyrophosphatase MutT (NUDIX family)